MKLTLYPSTFFNRPFPNPFLYTVLFNALTRANCLRFWHFSWQIHKFAALVSLVGLLKYIYIFEPISPTLLTFLILQNEISASTTQSIGSGLSNSSFFLATEMFKSPPKVRNSSALFLLLILNDKRLIKPWYDFH